MKFERNKDPKETLRVGKYAYSEVEIVAYSGAPYSFCSGDLVIKVGGVEWTLERPLSSGGNVWFDEDWSEHVEEGPWEINDWPDDFPEEAKKYVIDKVNEEIPWGCCGGCV